MAKIKQNPSLKVIDRKATIKPIDGLIWDKRGSWYLETIDNSLANYRIYGGVSTGSKAYKPFIGWCFSGHLEITTEKSFETELEAMKYVESNFNKKYYI